MLKHRYNEYTRKDTWNLNFWPPFCFEMCMVTSYRPLNRLWKRDPVFYFYKNRLSGYWYRRFKFITDSLPLFELKETFLTAKSEESMIWGDVMPHEMNEFTKKVSSTLLKNTTGFVKKIQWLTASVFYLLSIKATRVYLRLVYSCNCRQ